MTEKPVELRELARRDVDEAVEHYLTEAGASVALAFIDALEDSFRHIADHPAGGSPRYADELSLPGLRSWVVKDFPYLVFYVERDEPTSTSGGSCTRHATSRPGCENRPETDHLPPHMAPSNPAHPLETANP